MASCPDALLYRTYLLARVLYVLDYGTRSANLIRGAAKLNENDFQSSSVRELRIGLYWSTSFSHAKKLCVIRYVRTAYVFTHDIQGLTRCFTVQPERNLKCAKLGSKLENRAIWFSKSPRRITWKLERKDRHRHLIEVGKSPGYPSWGF